MADDLYSYIGANQGDSWDYLQQVLNTLSLKGDATTFVNNAYVNKFDTAQLVQGLRATDAYKIRFDAIIQRAKLGLPAISEMDVINLEKQYAQNRQAVGLPAGFYDSPQDFTQNIVNGVSAAEDQAKIQDGYLAAKNASPEVKQQIQDFYGTPLTDGEMAAFWLDPNKTHDIIQRQVASAQIGAQAQMTGYGAINKDQAENLYSQGITQQQAQQGFGQLAGEQQLFNGLPGQNEQNISQDQQFAATFGGNAQAQQAIEQQAKQRVATFKQGGGYAETKTGTSVGTAT